MKRCALLLAFAVTAEAQAPVGADTLSERAVADSQGVLAQMETVIRANRNDAAAWYRQGMVAWALTVRAEAKPPVGRLDRTRLRRLADTSLLIAAQLVPGKLEYQLAVGELLRSSTEIGPRTTGRQYLDAAVVIARLDTNVALRARTLIDVGRMRWLTYENDVNQLLRVDKTFTEDGGVRFSRDEVVAESVLTDARGRQACDLLSLSLEESMNRGPAGPMGAAVVASKSLHNELASCLRNPPQDYGDYERAEELFREAARLLPDDARGFRHLSMVLAERNRWSELAAIARDRTRRVPADAWGWLTLGLALQRGRDGAAANTAFNNGVERLPLAERKRLFAFERLMTRRDSIEFVGVDSATKRKQEAAFWSMGDPLWSREGNDPRTEFLARIVFAEIRWTVEEMTVRGANSDRGEIYIRYGPPTEILATRSSGLVVTYWDYAIGLTVVFWGRPSYGTVLFAAGDNQNIAQLVDAQPVAFDNVAAEKILDLPVRLARFRATQDSVDVVLFLHAPVPTIRQAGNAEAPARFDFWMFPRDHHREYRDSAAMSGSGVSRWIRRVPVADYFYRIETTADASMTAARAMGWFTAGPDTATGFATRGFGTSDLLLGTDARVTKQQPTRWTDFAIAPVINAVRKGSNLQLLWENYELAAQSGRSEYTIDVTLARQRSGRGQIVASVITTLAGAVGVDRQPDRVTYTFQRTTAASSGVVDFMSLAIGDTPVGEYRITVSITDKFSGRKASTSAVFSIVN